MSVGKERDWGYEIGKRTFKFILKIVGKYNRDGGKWSPRKPDFQNLVGSWAIVEFSVLSLLNPVLGQIWEDEDEEEEDGETFRLRSVVDLRTLTYEESCWINQKGVSALHILEPPEVSDARTAVKEVESEKLHKAIDSEIATYSHVILKLKTRIEDARVAELINYLMEAISSQEESTDEAQIIGEKLAGGPSKKEKELKEFVDKSESVQKWVKSMEERSERLEGSPIEKVVADARKMRQDREGDEEVLRFTEWIDILASMRDPAVDDVIRKVFFDIESIK